MKQLSKIPLVQTANGDNLPRDLFSSVVLSSASTPWPGIVVEQHNFSSHELDDVMYMQPVVALNLGPQISVEFKKNGRFQRMSKASGSIYLSSARNPFHIFRRLQKEQRADVLYLAFDPIFISRAAEDLDIYPDRAELVEQQREYDSILWHLAQTLHASLSNVNLRNDALFGEAMATALAVHLVREYSTTQAELRLVRRGLTREQLTRAIEYIQDQLHKDLRVAGIARAAHMSPHHFTLLFRESTGQTPYRYVIEARARRARDLLTTGKFSISEVASQVGFADQSHLTRHVKQLFGITPKIILAKHRLETDSPKQTEDSSR
jgi:AraC family transcriptional regulator